MIFSFHGFMLLLEFPCSVFLDEFEIVDLRSLL